ncbi:MAG: restriction endonuclease [Phycisphaerales bacterium]
MGRKAGSGPRFVRYFSPLVAVLRDLGGSARPAEAYQGVVVKMGLTDEILSETLPSGWSRFENQVAWARFYLVKAGVIDASKRGVWTLTEKGRQLGQFTYEDALRLFKEVHTQFQGTEKDSCPGENDETTAAPPEGGLPSSAGSYRQAVLERLRALPASGFERFAQRLLRESDFEEVTVTGRSGDGGIDGVGILQVNAFVSFKVLFQCKKYSGAVSASHVRDFRGAMQGRADKGIILTTGVFTADAKREAVRDGVPPIELVDGEKLVSMLEKLELGLKPMRAFTVDDEFFMEFEG